MTGLTTVKTELFLSSPLSFICAQVCVWQLHRFGRGDEGGQGDLRHRAGHLHSRLSRQMARSILDLRDNFLSWQAISVSAACWGHDGKQLWSPAHSIYFWQWVCWTPMRNPLPSSSVVRDRANIPSSGACLNTHRKSCWKRSYEASTSSRASYTVVTQSRALPVSRLMSYLPLLQHWSQAGEEQRSLQQEYLT